MCEGHGKGYWSYVSSPRPGWAGFLRVTFDNCLVTTSLLVLMHLSRLFSVSDPSSWVIVRGASKRKTLLNEWAGGKVCAGCVGFRNLQDGYGKSSC